MRPAKSGQPQSRLMYAFARVLSSGKQLTVGGSLLEADTWLKLRDELCILPHEKAAAPGMICPYCRCEECVRSHRRGIADWLAGVAALRPWRCIRCKSRFYGNAVALTFLRHAHCPRCGNLELQRIAKEWVVEGRLRWFFRSVNAPAYRCEPCRHRFFSFRPASESRVASAQTAADEISSR